MWRPQYSDAQIRAIRRRMTPEQVVQGLELEARKYPGCLARAARARRARKAFEQGKHAAQCLQEASENALPPEDLSEAPAVPLPPAPAPVLDPHTARLQALRARLQGRTLAPGSPAQAQTPEM